MARARSQNSSGPPVEDSVNTAGERLIDVLPPARAPRSQGASVVTALLPSGRTAWLHLHPSPASTADVNRLARVARYADTRRALTTRADALAIERLARTVASSTRELAQARLRADRELLAGIAAGDRKVDRAIDAAGAKSRMTTRRELAELGRSVDKLRRRDIWDALVLVSGAPLFAAYGRRKHPFAPANLALLISLGVWLAGDEVSDWLTGEKTIAAGVLRDVDVWSYLAPFANVLTGWWLLHEAQNERFVTGVTNDFGLWQSIRPPASKTLIDVYLATVDLAGTVIGEDYAADFASFSNVPVVATIVSWTVDPFFDGQVELGPLTATVSSGVLTMQLTVTSPSIGATSTALLTALEVAWMVDTQEPGT